MKENFIKACLENKATFDDIDNWVERWHKDPNIDLTLHEFLGGEYSLNSPNYT